MLLFGRASPADCADEDVHNPSVDGLQYVSDSFLHAKSGDFAAPESRLLHVGCNGGSCRRASYVSGAEVLQRSETIAPTHGLRNRPDKRCNGVVGGEKSVFTRTPSRYVGQKSPVFMRTDFGTYQELGCFNGRKPSLLRVGCNGAWKICKENAPVRKTLLNRHPHRSRRLQASEAESS